MGTIDDFRKSIKDKSDEELMEMLKKIRASRRARTERAPRAKKSPAAKPDKAQKSDGPNEEQLRKIKEQFGTDA